MRLTEEQTDRYEAGKLEDSFIRSTFMISYTRYYSIALFPPEKRGTVTIDYTRIRDVPKNKISKSDQNV